jgi:oxygen-independent coproporphyrinogen-3 oxidase
MSTFHTLPPLSLYVHVPWCVRKCPYCDFNSHEAKEGIPEEAYLDALIADLEQELPDVWGRPVVSIFIGGGTPSLISPEGIDRLLQAIRARLRVLPEAEITLEANPGTVDEGRFTGFRAAGVNRLSIGVQSFDDALLKRIGRIHGRAEAIRAVKAAHAAGFINFNLDLMFGLPGQTLAQAEADVAQAIALAPTHVSYYQLTLEPNTTFAHAPPVLPEDDLRWEMQGRGHALLAAAGYRHYEVSAWARDGFRCTHNLNYWQFGDYLGIGAGAHGKLTLPVGGPSSARIAEFTANGKIRAEDGPPTGVSSPSVHTTHRILRRWKLRHPKDYLEHAATPQRLGGEEEIAAADLAFEFMLNALRLPEGIPEALFSERTGLPLAGIEETLRAAEGRGLLLRDGGRLRTTEQGALFLNELLEMFLP